MSRVLLVHPDRYRQIMDSAVPMSFLPNNLYEVHQSPYVPLTTPTQQPRPWWAFWWPKYVTVEQPILGFFYTERGAGEPIPLPRSFATRKQWPERAS